MEILLESSITLTWRANTAVKILIGVEYAVAGFASLLEFEGGIIGAGWSALPQSMVENVFHPKLFHQELYGAIFKRRIVLGGDNLAVVAVVVWRKRRR